MSVLIDSNVVIYASKMDARGTVARAYIEAKDPAVSVVSRVEALGYHRLSADERILLDAFFQIASVLLISPDVVERAIHFRQRRAMSLGDALIAGTAVVHGLDVATHNVKDFDWIDEITVTDPFA